MDKEQRAKLLTEIMEENQKNGLYDNHISDTNKMVTMKLYTEEQVRIAMSEARYAFTTEKSYDEIVQSLKPIELPSDEEINKFFLDNSYEYGYGYRDAIDLVKKQILNQNK